MPSEAIFHAFKKGPGADEPRASSVGNRLAELAAGRIKGDGTMIGQAIKLNGTSLFPQKSIVPITERDAAQEFSAVIIPFTAGELAQAAKRSKEAAKAWKEGRSMPSGWSLLNMAQEIPEVRNWMLSKLGVGARVAIESPEGAAAAAMAVLAVAAMPGPGGDAVRAMLAKKGEA